MAQPETLDVNSIIAEASAKTGLENFGVWNFREALERLLISLDSEAQLTVDGRAGHRQKIVEILCTRLQLEDLVARHPEILQEQITNPIVIVGLPRSGTTVLQRMLAADDRFYSAAYWEVRFPVPREAELLPGATDPRRIAVKAEVQYMLETVPELAAIHPLDADAADEEISLLEQSFYSTSPESFANVPSYGNWLANQDQTEAYEYLKRLLQCLQWQKKRSGAVRDRWVLKTPHHIHWMDVLFKVFPDVRVIQTHRDPLQTIPSLASFVYRLRQLASDSVDAASVGQQWNAKMAAGLARCMEVRASLPADRFLDIDFFDTVKQPMSTVESIYSFIGIKLTAPARNSIEQWRSDNRRDKRAPHNYVLSQFGLTEEQLKQDYSEYRRHYIDH